MSIGRPENTHNGGGSFTIWLTSCLTDMDSTKQLKHLGGSPGLVVMGDDSCSKGHGFESRRRILDGLTFFHIDLL